MTATPDDAPVEPYSFGNSARLTAQKAGLYQEASVEIASRVALVVKEWIPGFVVEAGPLVETEPGQDTTDGADDFDAVAVMDGRVPGGFVRTQHSLALSVVNALLGGAALPAGITRSLTSIETRVLDLLIEPILAEAADVLLLDGVTLERELKDGFVAGKDDAPRAAIGFVLDFTAPVGGGRLVIELDSETLEHFSDALDRRLSGRREVTPTQHSADTAAALQGVPIPISVDLGRVTLSAGEVVSLQPGDVLRVRQPVDQPLTASVGEQELFRVRMGRRGPTLVAEILSAIGEPLDLLAGPSLDLSSNPLLSPSRP